MTNETGSWIVVLIALIGANFPFFTQKLFGLFGRFGAGKRNQTAASGAVIRVKPLWLRLIELLVFYCIVGAIGFALETAVGNRFPQGWQFYAITGCLFVVMAFPGFVYCYLLRR